MKTLILMANGFEEIEAVTVIDILRRANVTCDICSVENTGKITGSHKITIDADVTLNELTADGNNTLISRYDACILPGGMPGSANLRDNDKVIETVKGFFNAGKIIAAICAAPIVFERAGFIKGCTVTSYPGCLAREGETYYTGDLVSRDKNIITGKAPGAAAEFSYTILDALGLDKISKKLKQDMFFCV